MNYRCPPALQSRRKQLYCLNHTEKTNISDSQIPRNFESCYKTERKSIPTILQTLKVLVRCILNCISCTNDINMTQPVYQILPLSAPSNILLQWLLCGHMYVKHSNITLGDKVLIITKSFYYFDNFFAVSSRYFI